MKKSFLILLVFIFSFINVFSINYDELTQEARALAWSGEYKKAINIYENLIREYQNKEVYLDYSNALAWSGDIKKAIDLLNSFGGEDSDIEMRKARFFYWNLNFSEAYNIFSKYKKDELEESDLAFINWYEEYKHFFIKTSYITDFLKENRENQFNLYMAYNYYDVFSVALRFDNFFFDDEYRVGKSLIEFYYDDFFSLLGISHNQYYIAEFGYVFKPFTLGFKSTKYLENYDEFIKSTSVNGGYFVFNFMLENIEFLLRANLDFIYKDYFYKDPENDLVFSYLIGSTYKNFGFKHYFDLKELNKSFIEYKDNICDFNYSISFYYDFFKKNFGAGISLGYSF